MSSPPEGDEPRSQKQLSEELLDAVNEDELPRVLALLNEGADINYRGDVGETALIVAAHRMNLNIVRLLLEKGADKSIRASPDGDFEGRNALETAQHYARFHPGNPDVPIIIGLLSVNPPGGEPAGGAKKKNKKGGRRFTRKQCKKFKCAKMGFTQKASCRPYKNCYRSTAGVHKKRSTHKR
jgi:Ankyrin repeats (3 copies)